MPPMNRAFSRYAVMALCAAWMLAGCSQQGSAPTAGQQQAQA
jgi:hypothetical protein